MFQGETGGDHFAKNRPQGLGRERTGVLGAEARVDLLLPLRHVKVEVLLRLEATNLQHQLRTAVQQAQDF